MDNRRTTPKLNNMHYRKNAIKKTRLTCGDLHTDESRNMMQKKQEPINSLFEQAVMGIAYLDEHNHVTTANEAFQDLVQYSLDDLQEIPFSHIIYPADLEKEQVLRKEVLEGKRKDYSLEQRYIRKDGELVWVSAHTTYIQESQDVSVQTVIFAHDISAWKHHEQELLKANSIKDKFFMIIGHDLRNPIESIKILTSFIEHELEQNNIDSIREITSMLSDQADHTQKLLSNLLRWSQAQTKQISFNPKQLNITAIIQEQVRENSPIAHNKNIVLEQDLDMELWVDADAEMLKVILRNLITNAIKFSYADSTVWLKAQERTDDVLITIEDQGKGIPPLVFDKLFHPESKVSTNGTQDERGTGLGLLLCKEFVEYHGGKIWAESSQDKGSKFMFTLPKSS